MGRPPLNQPPPGVTGNPPRVVIAAAGAPGGLYGEIKVINRDVIYLIGAITLRAANMQHPSILRARAAHRYMIRRAADMAQGLGRWSFKLQGINANADFRAYANRLATSIGVAGSGIAIGANYEVALVVAKVMATR